jgi:hypothetical protein
MLTDHKNDLFATHETMPSALRYVNDLCAAAASSADSIAIRTAAAVIMNTAIELHRAEKKVLVDKINEMSARANPVTALLTLVQEQVAKAIAEQSRTIEEQMHNWAADHFADRADEWYGNNVDVGEAIEQHIEHNMNLDETIAEQISNYFGNNTFSIEPN